MLEAGYKANVIPGEAHALSRRPLPARATRRSSSTQIDEIIGPDVTRDFVIHDIALETDFDGDWSTR